MTMNAYETNLLDVAESALARTRSGLNRETIATVERFGFDGDGSAILLTGVDGSRLVVFDAWRPNGKYPTRISGKVYPHPEDGRMIGAVSRNRLDYDSTPQDSDDWKNVPDGIWEAAKKYAAGLYALEVSA